MASITPFTQFSIRYKAPHLLQVLDQRLLPDEEVWLDVNAPEDMVLYIKQLSVRGAPLIGVAAAYSLADWVIQAENAGEKLTPEQVKKVAQMLRDARPTAVNLMFAIDKMIQIGSAEPDFSGARLSVIASELMNREVEMCASMSKFGAALIKDGDGILTHCNTGALAVPGMGTALGVIREAWKQGKKIHVYVDETRPLLQGGRLTTYELKREGIPYTLICDNMAAVLMKQGKIQRVLVGADRIALNGDFANKIGTYSVAILSKYHNVPFHGVAPLSTVDFNCESGQDIPIEQRSPFEVLGASGSFGKIRWAPEDSHTFNPAFDVTPVDLVESLILDTGIYETEKLKTGCLRGLKKG
eukprot:TRINITY_DN1869_c0_g1_i1.p1 TRINITY_DN1869_c0_g1~~TRINITY_DN1869_c0_g1_i1.p1  ORF type:complete len:376 (-),score=80.20 TRINITY_DN1869_c0_g1_i1:42-1109(-)